MQVTKEREKEISDDEAEDEEKEEKKDQDAEDKEVSQLALLISHTNTHTCHTPPMTFTGILLASLV